MVSHRVKTKVRTKVKVKDNLLLNNKVIPTLANRVWGKWEDLPITTLTILLTLEILISMLVNSRIFTLLALAKCTRPHEDLMANLMALREGGKVWGMTSITKEV